MDYERTLMLSVIFVFSVFLFPSMNTAVEAVSLSEPLQPLIAVTPHIWLLCLLILLVYSVIKHE